MFRAKRLYSNKTFVSMGVLGVLCLLSCSAFIPTQYRSFCEQNPASNLCRYGFVNQTETISPVPEILQQATVLTNSTAEPLVATVIAAPEIVAPIPESPLQTPVPSMSSANNFPEIEITECAHSPFALQIGAYKMRIDAERQIARFRRNGETARIIKVEIPNKGIWYRVQVGNFTECADAIQSGQKLQADKEFSEFIVTDYQNPAQ